MSYAREVELDLDRWVAAPADEVRAAGRELAGDLETLNKWLGTRKDERAIHTCFELLDGIGEKRALAWHHGFYWRLIVYSWEVPPTDAMVRVLARVEAVCPNTYARRNVRRLFRQIYERGSHAAMSEQARAAIVASGVAWEWRPLRNVDEAWDVLLALATGDDVEPRAAGGCPNVWEVVECGAALAGDVLLARFMAEHPRALEGEVLARVDELATPRNDRGDENALSHVLESGISQPRTWARTHATWDAELGLQLFERAQREKLLHATAEHNSFNIACEWAARAPSGLGGMTPEMRDVLRALVDGSPLPDILPADLAGMSGADIEAALAAYAGITVRELYERFAPGELSDAGFIGDGENLGELIARDAATLRALGISRFELADRLQAVIAATPLDDEQRHVIGDVQVSATAYLGHQHEPFHVYDVYSLIGHLGARDFSVRRGELEIRGGDLQVSMIRRACFFGGTKSYRLDPEITARIIGLIAGS